MDHLDRLESQSIFILREAYKQFKDIAVLWSIGKDSTTLMWLIRKAFFGRIPFPALHIDTGYKFQEIYDFRTEWAKNWNLDLITAKNIVSLEKGMGPDCEDKLACCGQLKTDALKQAINEYKFKALLLGIRRDEHGIRAKERVFSPRNKQFQWDYKDQPPELWDHYKNKQQGEQHIRVHPLLDWTELDIWKYIERENMPVVSLYFSKNGKRYRSIGCEPCCEPVNSDATTVTEIINELETTNVSERSGRAQDKERAYMMQKLRSLGYM